MESIIGTHADSAYFETYLRTKVRNTLQVYVQENNAPLLDVPKLSFILELNTPFLIHCLRQFK